jgi:hypothetical protein
MCCWSAVLNIFGLGVEARFNYLSKCCWSIPKGARRLCARQLCVWQLCADNCVYGQLCASQLCVQTIVCKIFVCGQLCAKWMSVMCKWIFLSKSERQWTNKVDKITKTDQDEQINEHYNMNIWAIAFIFYILSFVGLFKIRKTLDTVYRVLILFYFSTRPLTSWEIALCTYDCSIWRSLKEHQNPESTILLTRCQQLPEFIIFFLDLLGFFNNPHTSWNKSCIDPPEGEDLVRVRMGVGARARMRVRWNTDTANKSG